jgi:agmatinase
MSMDNTSDRYNIIPRHFIGCGCNYKDADVVVFGAPFDGTVTFRSGSRFAPARMREDSWGLETYSPLLDQDLDDRKINDAGDLDIPFGNTENALSMIGNITSDILRDKKKPFMIGGEHLVTLPSIMAFLNIPEYKDLCLIHLDAHTDLREHYIAQPLSHSTVIRRIWDHMGDGRIWQFGIRSGTREEFTWANDGHTSLFKYTLDQIYKAKKEIGNRPVYVTIDLDVLDPSIMPGTGTPEAGGVSYREMEQAILALKDFNIKGADIVELSPHYDHSGASTMVACKVMREMLLVI